MKDSNARSNLFFQWIRRIAQWFRDQFQPGYQSPRILEEYYADLGALLRLECEQPGVVDLWKLVHQSATHDLLISLISLRQLREDLAALRQHHGKFVDRGTWRRAFETELADQLENQSTIDGSHIILVAWVSRVPLHQRIDPDGQIHSFCATECSYALLCDLQGATFAWATENSYARKIVYAIVQRLLKLQPSRLNSWEELVRAIDWRKWLEFYARHFLGSSHTLQPPKAKFKVPRNEPY